MLEIVPINTENIKLQQLKLGTEKAIEIDVLRLDLIHPIISGNKWYKLRFYLEDAIKNNCSEIASFGGAYSNHIVAMACACFEKKIKNVGFIRGDEIYPLSETLQSAKDFGMELHFINRLDYKNKNALIETNQKEGRYWIPEGGYGILGAKGAATMLESVHLQNYQYLVAAIGSGTMVAGLLNASLTHQKVIGISSQKNNSRLVTEISALVAPQNMGRFQFLSDYHFGGFAKHPDQLLAFMRDFWIRESIPTDIVYTSKLFYAMTDLVQKDFFKKGDRVLVIHSGGLQGNRSLPKNTLPF